MRRVGRVGLVLGAGGSFGWDWTIGALAAVRDATGFDPRDAHDIVGTSVGSLVGAYLRHDVGLDRLASHVEGLPAPAGVENEALLPPTPLAAGVGRRAVVGVRRGVGTAVGIMARRPDAPDPRLGDELARKVGRHDWPPRPLTVVSWSRSTRRRVAHHPRGELPLPRAVDASCAIPGAMPPVPTTSHGELVDGGVHSMTNADLLAHDVDLAVVVAPLVLGHGGAGASVNRFVRLVHRWTLAVELAGAHAPPALVLAPSAGTVERLQRAERRDRVAIARAEAAAVLRHSGSDRVAAALRTAART